MVPRLPLSGEPRALHERGGPVGTAGLTQRVTRRAVRYGWGPLVALAATTALESGERQSLSQAVDGIHGIKHVFHVSDGAVGWLPFAMALIGVLGAFPIGILTDRIRRTWLLVVAMAIWTACMGLNGLATSFAFLFIARLGVGAVEANGPAALSLLSDYYPVKDRARMMGLYQSGALGGAIIGLIGGGIAVSAGDWRWAFWMWVPFGLAACFYMARQPEPTRGDHDAEFEADMAVTVAGTDVADVASVTGLLPDPIREGTLDYTTATHREVVRELFRIPSMWFGVMSLTISQFLLFGLQFWGVPYFKRVHHLGPAAAGGLTALLGMGSVFGILGGGFLADRYLKRGVINARVYVVAFGSIAASLVLAPAFASTNLVVTAPLFFIGGAFLTLPVAPSEALTSDVVVAELRGRAFTVRSVVRALSNIGPLLIGLLSNEIGLRMALVAFCPVYAVGGVVMLFAVRTYPTDVAFVVAESRRRRGLDARPVAGEVRGEARTDGLSGPDTL